MYLIKATGLKKLPATVKTKLRISELFINTIQGEGPSAGKPAVFLRLAGCTLNCKWCDSAHLWAKSEEWAITPLIHLFATKVEPFLKRGHILVITGGSPLIQQEALSIFLNRLDFVEKGYKVEIENELILPINHAFEFAYMYQYVTFNNSPKLSNSGNIRRTFSKVALFDMQSSFNGIYKFVISSPEDWDEIVKNYLPYIRRNQIYLMPCGATRKELQATRQMVVNVAIEHDVNYSDRLQIVIWDDKDGV